ncbi:MAG: S1 family peptidase [Pseudonocardiales bacterium]|nr:S1 family peptidase [Pseudonocardiales bacterium]
MLVRSHPHALAAAALVGAALGALLSAAVALPASAAVSVLAAPASREPLRAAPRLAAQDLLTLQRALAVLDFRSGRVPNSVTRWYIDPASDSVVVSATNDAAARAFAAGQGKVRIEHVNARPVPLAGLRGGDTITTSSGERCSVGFNAVKGHTRYVITAGHCTRLGGTWSGPDGSAIGPVATSSFPGHDFGLVEVASLSWEQTHDVNTDDGYLPVTGVAPAEVGDEVCLSGSTTGYHCGRVEAIGVTVNYGDGEVVRGLTRTSVCAEAGDSGGSFMSGTQAQGTLSGGSGGCLISGESYFQPIQEVLSSSGLTLITGGELRENQPREDQRGDDR